MEAGILSDEIDVDDGYGVEREDEREGGREGGSIRGGIEVDVGGFG